MNPDFASGNEPIGGSGRENGKRENPLYARHPEWDPANAHLDLPLPPEAFDGLEAIANDPPAHPRIRRGGFNETVPTSRGPGSIVTYDVIDGVLTAGEIDTDPRGPYKGPFPMNGNGHGNGNGNPRVLIVDDEEPIRDLLGMVVRKVVPGVPVDTAANFAEAERYLNEHVYTAVISDGNFPVGDEERPMEGLPGIHVLRQAYERNPDARLTLITGETWDTIEGQVERLRKEGVEFTYIPKPFKGDQISAVLRSQPTE